MTRAYIRARGARVSALKRGPARGPARGLVHEKIRVLSDTFRRASASVLCPPQGLCYADRTMVLLADRSTGSRGAGRFIVSARSRLGPARILRYVLGAALFIALTSAPAWARWATRFHDIVAKAPLIIRAKVLSKSPSPQNAATGGVEVQLAVERTLVGPSVGPSLTLTMPNRRHAAPLDEGGLYLLLLESPTSLYNDHNSCGTTNFCEVVGGKVPRFRQVSPQHPNLTDYLYGHTVSLAEAENTIIAERCHDGQICPDDYKPHRLAVFMSRYSLQHLLMLVAALALAGYSWWLARSRTMQGTDEAQQL